MTRFYAGGGVSMRGFADRRLSPCCCSRRRPTRQPQPSLITMPIGGNGLVDGSFEVALLA